MATMHAAPGSALIGELFLCAAPLILRPVALPPQILDLVERVVQPAQLGDFRRVGHRFAQRCVQSVQFAGLDHPTAG